MTMNQRIAELERQKESADATHNENIERINTITARINAIFTRQQAITRARIEGASNTTETAEYAALSGDAEALNSMLQKAQSEADRTQKVVNDLTAELARVRADHALELKHETMHALRHRILEIETVLMQAVRELHQEGVALGQRQLSQNWQPSSELYRAITLGVPPA